MDEAELKDKWYMIIVVGKYSKNAVYNGNNKH